MKFSFKLAFVAFLMLSLCLSFGGVFAQTSGSITVITVPTTVDLNSVFIVNNVTNNNNDLTMLNAWAVGNDGVILRWSGTAWEMVTSPTAANLYSVFFINSTYGWAVGGNETNGVILNYNGTWNIWRAVSNTGTTSAQDSINAPLYSITMDSAGMVGWAVGGNGTMYGWNGQACYMVPSITNVTLRSVAMVHNSTQAWAVGDNGTILAYTDNTMWTKVNSPTNANLYGLSLVNTTMGWAVGGTATNGTIIALNGASWFVWNKISFGGSAANDVVNATIYSLSINNATSAWAVGAKGTVLYWGGTQWDGQSNVTLVDLKGVSMVHGNFPTIGHAWAVGNSGRILAWAGAIWIPEFPTIAIPVLLTIGFVVVILGRAKLLKKSPLF
jgi:hypothetical protein